MADAPAPWRLLSLVPLPPEAIAGLLSDDRFAVIAPPELTLAATQEVSGDVDLILGGWQGAVPIGPDLLRAAPRVAGVMQPSVGVDSIDVEALAAAGIPVANAAGFNSQAVAEWCLAAALSCLRLIGPADQEVRDGGWPQLELAGRGARELAGARVGIVGFGAIGQTCARLFRSLGCDVGQWSRRQRDEEPWFELDELVRRSEILLVVVALAEQTRGLLSAELLATMPRDAILVNAARGHVVDEDAVAVLIASGHLAAAAFDVFGAEPLPLTSPLRADRRILLSPHAAGSSRQSQLRLLTAIKTNLVRAVSGEPLENVVNGVDPVVRRR